MEDNVKETGVIKVYYPLKGYGFITRERGRDIFFHRTDIGNEIWALEGVRVVFLAQKTTNGWRASDITKIG